MSSSNAHTTDNSNLSNMTTNNLSPEPDNDDFETSQEIAFGDDESTVVANLPMKKYRHAQNDEKLENLSDRKSGSSLNSRRTPIHRDSGTGTVTATESTLISSINGMQLQSMHIPPYIDNLDEKFIKSLDHNYCYSIQRNYPCNFVHEPSSTLKCSICFEIVCYPMVLICGHNACLSCCDQNFGTQIPPQGVGISSDWYNNSGHEESPDNHSVSSPVYVSSRSQTEGWTNNLNQPPTRTQSSITIFPPSRHLDTINQNLEYTGISEISTFNSKNSNNDNTPRVNQNFSRFGRNSLPRHGPRSNVPVVQQSRITPLPISSTNSTRRNTNTTTPGTKNYNKRESCSQSPSQSSEVQKLFAHTSAFTSKKSNSNQSVSQNSQINIRNNLNNSQNNQSSSVYCNICKKSVEMTKISALPAQTQVMNLLIKCKNRTCNATFKLGIRLRHEDKCQLEEIYCRNNPNICGVFLKKDLKNHLNSCQYYPCKFKSFGCTFSANLNAIKQHESTCQHFVAKQAAIYIESKFKPFFQQLAQENNDLKLRISNHENSQHTSTQFQIASLKQNVTNLENELREVKSALSLMNESTIGRAPMSVNGGGWNPQQMFKCRGTFVGHKKPVWSLLVYGDKLYSGSGDMTIKVWDCVVTFKNLKTLTGHEDQILCLAATGCFLFSGSTDKTIRAWSTRNLTSLGVVYRDVSEDYGTCFSALCALDLKSGSPAKPSSNKFQNITGILYAGSQYKLRIFLVSNNEINEHECNSNEHNDSPGPVHGEIPYQHSNRSTSRSSRTFRNSTGVSGVVLYRQIDGFAGYVRDIKVHEDQLFIAAEGDIKIFSVANYNLINTIKIANPGRAIYNHGQPVVHTFFSLTITSNYIISGTNYYMIYVHNRRDFTFINELSGHLGTVNNFAVLQVANDNNRVRLFSASDDKSLRVWNLDNMVCTQSMIRHTSGVTGLAASQGMIFSGSMDMTVKVWQ